ncbi:hypothetical protein [Tolypothrix sp. VBCCA 56010]
MGEWGRGGGGAGGVSIISYPLPIPHAQCPIPHFLQSSDDG